jgi:hypothetical protein
VSRRRCVKNQTLQRERREIFKRHENERIHTALHGMKMKESRMEMMMNESFMSDPTARLSLQMMILFDWRIINISSATVKLCGSKILVGGREYFD